jgi:hypothetical protein
VSKADRLRKRECLRLAADCMQLAGDVHGPALQSHFLRMVKAWPIPVQAGKAPARITQAKRVQIFKRENPSPQIRGALAPMALMRQLKKLRQENASLRRRLLMQTDCAR